MTIGPLGDKMLWILRILDLYQKTRTMRLPIFLLIFFLINSPSQAAVIYVDDSASGNNDGSSWTDAYTDLQIAIEQAQAGDELWVAEGVYVPTKSFNNDGTPAPGSLFQRQYFINKDISLYGGFAGTETMRDERDSEMHLTILSGDLDGDDMNADGNYVAENYTDIIGLNSMRVLLIADVGQDFVLDGFIITACDGRPRAHYVGVYLRNIAENLDATFQSCTFIGNVGYRGVGITALSFGNKSLVCNIINCTFTRNKTSDRAVRFVHLCMGRSCYN